MSATDAADTTTRRRTAARKVLRAEFDIDGSGNDGTTAQARHLSGTTASASTTTITSKSYTSGEGENVKTALDREIRRTSGLTRWQNLAYLMVFYGACRYFDVAEALLRDPRINWDLMNAFIGLALLAMAIGGYCIVYLRSMCGIEAYDEHAPWAVPASTLAGLGAVVAVTSAIWPIWSWVSLPLVWSGLMAWISLIAIISPLFA